MRLLAWLGRPSKRWEHFRHVPLSRLVVLLSAVFLLFSTTGFYYDLMDGGTLPYAIVLVMAAVSGLNAIAWILVLARTPVYCIFLLAAAQFFIQSLQHHIALWIRAGFHPRSLAATTGIHFAATSTLIVVILSYIGFVHYMRSSGRETLRLKTELDLAHSIQKTLVPPVERTTPSYEIFGISEPSEKVGGDLVDIVDLEHGDLVAYLADIAGHGLQAGILMGMLKTAARTALLDPGAGAGAALLSTLMERLNRVLPGVKEPHMYATFTALRLNFDGQAFYGMAASPPLLHWSSDRKTITRVEQEQFPLGLLPVSGFPASPIAMEPGDLVLIATDGLLEVCAGRGPDRDVEFGVNRMVTLLQSRATLPLPQLAGEILIAVRAYGRQLDDQTLLLVRRKIDRPVPQPSSVIRSDPGAAMYGN